MNTGEALLHACLDNPDDDTPRLVYADWLQENGDPDRAEFIRLQIEIARQGYIGCIPAGIEDREWELRTAHEAEWNPLPHPLWRSAIFDRGFIDHVDVLTDEEAAAVARHREVLSVSVDTDVTEVGLGSLAAHPYLEELYFRGGIIVTPNGMQALARLPRLRRLEIHDGAISGPWLHYFRDTPRLVRIRTYSPHRDEATPEEWTAWEEARAERFRRSSPEEQRRAARAFLFDELEYERWRRDGQLQLTQTHLTDADVELLAVLPGLQNLDLYETKITNRALCYLSSLKELHTLKIGSNALDNLDGLAGMTQLRELNLGCMHIYHSGTPTEYLLTDAGTSALSTLTGLESLCLSFNPVTDVTLERISELTNLRKLELESVGGITDAGLLHLKGLKKLEQLDLRSTAITAKGAKKLLAHLPRVKIKRE
jgi:uncharacterized protein (TIGR02996 family)